MVKNIYVNIKISVICNLDRESNHLHPGRFMLEQFIPKYKGLKYRLFNTFPASDIAV